MASGSMISCQSSRSGTRSLTPAVLIEGFISRLFSVLGQFLGDAVAQQGRLAILQINLDLAPGASAPSCFFEQAADAVQNCRFGYIHGFTSGQMLMRLANRSGEPAMRNPWGVRARLRAT